VSDAGTDAATDGMTDVPVPLPPNVVVGPGSTVVGDVSFKRFHARRQPAVRIGSGCRLDGTHFAVGEDGEVEIGDHCYFTNAILLVERQLRVGSCVMVGWNTVIADTDFHPVGPAERIADAVACSPLGGGRGRPTVARLPVTIDDDVWIGPNVTVLKGVHIGAGAFVEPGSVVLADVPAGARVLGNPARIVEGR